MGALRGGSPVPRADRLSPGAVKLLKEPQLAHVTTLMPDGSPQTTVIWIDAAADGSHVLVNTGTKHLAYWDRSRRGQLEALGDNPRVCVFYRDPARRVSYRFYGQATVHADGPVREQVMARTVQAELDRDPERQGVAIVIRVDRVMTLGNQVLQERAGAPETPARTLNL